MLLEFSSFISVKYVCNMFSTKVQQSFWYTKLCNYIEEFELKPISKIPNIFACCNKFHYALKCFLLSNGWGSFSWLSTIKKWKIVSSFSSLILHAVNFLLWKKIITASRPTTLRVLLMGRSGCPTKRGNCDWVCGGGGRGRGLPVRQKYHILVNSTYWEKSISNSF